MSIMQVLDPNMRSETLSTYNCSGNIILKKGLFGDLLCSLTLKAALTSFKILLESDTWKTLKY